MGRGGVGWGGGVGGVGEMEEGGRCAPCFREWADVLGGLAEEVRAQLDLVPIHHLCQRHAHIAEALVPARSTTTTASREQRGFVTELRRRGGKTEDGDALFCLALDLCADGLRERLRRRGWG